MFAGYMWVGQVPAEPMTITVVDQHGTPIDLSAETNVQLTLLDPANREVDTSDGAVVIADAARGRIGFYWPQESLFKTPGDYVFQLRIGPEGRQEMTTEATFVVRRLGR